MKKADYRLGNKGLLLATGVNVWLLQETHGQAFCSALVGF